MASIKDVRRVQVYQAQTGVQAPTINSSVSALCFLFTVTTVTLDRSDQARCLVLACYQRKLPTVLSVEEVGRLL